MSYLQPGRRDVQAAQEEKGPQGPGGEKVSTIKTLWETIVPVQKFFQFGPQRA